MQPITRQIRPVPALVFRTAAPVFARRHYASGSLAKDEVEKRIIEILKGFDKVTDPAKVCLQFAFGKGLGVHVLMKD